MTTSPHTPDPAMGALIDALGSGHALIYEPDDNEPMRAQIIRFGQEQIADWVAYLRATGIRSRIAASGLQFTGPVEHSGNGAYVKRRFAEAFANGSALDGEYYDEVRWNRSAGSGIRFMRSLSPIPPGNITLRIWAPQDSFGLPIELRREGGAATLICTFPANVYSSATLSYWSLSSEWRLAGGYNIDLTGAAP